MVADHFLKLNIYSFRSLRCYFGNLCLATIHYEHSKLVHKKSTCWKFTQRVVSMSQWGFHSMSKIYVHTTNLIHPYSLSGLVDTVYVTYCDSPVRGYCMVKLPRIYIHVIFTFYVSSLSTLCRMCNFPFVCFHKMIWNMMSF